MYGLSLPKLTQEESNMRPLKEYVPKFQTNH